VPHLEDYFVEGEEIGVFDNEDDLIPQIRYWLEHPEERAAVAEAGYRRVLAEHTYDDRFEEIFRVAGLA
jgi:spore maturation protein CgeB